MVFGHQPIPKSLPEGCSSVCIKYQLNEKTKKGGKRKKGRSQLSKQAFT
jgi:hypothetical protein